MLFFSLSHSILNQNIAAVLNMVLFGILIVFEVIYSLTMPRYKYVSKLAIKLLEGFDLYEHFLALRRYYFMEVADWTDLFISSLWHHVHLLNHFNVLSAGNVFVTLSKSMLFFIIFFNA